MDTNNQLKYDEIIAALGGVVDVTQAAATAAQAAAASAAAVVAVANEQVSEVVQNYAGIPNPEAPDAALYLVLESSGGIFGNQYPAGFYRDVAGTWTYIGPNSNGLMANVIVTNSPTVDLQDGAGNAISSTSGALNVNVTNSTPGAATAANQSAELALLTSIETNTASTGTVSVSNFPSTQNVSVVSCPATCPVLVSNFPVTQPVSIASMPTTPVTGTFWQATQPIFGSVSVSGTVAATQSGAWNIGTLTSITNPVAVTGSFYQATQPVSLSGTVAVIQSTSPWVTSLASTTITGSVAVTGTFFQATQPVSISGTVPISGTVTVSNDFSVTANQTTVAISATTSTLILAANANRKGVYVNTSGSKPVFITYGSAGTNSASIFTVMAPAINGTNGGAVWFMPYPIYQGALYGYTSGAETIIITELI